MKEGNMYEARFPERRLIAELPTAISQVTDRQISRLYAIALGHRWNRPQLQSLLQRSFSKSDPYSLTRKEYDQVCNFILSTRDYEMRHAS